MPIFPQLFAAAAHWGNSAWHSIDGGDASTLELVAADAHAQLTDFTLYCLGWGLVVLSALVLALVLFVWVRSLVRHLPRRGRVAAVLVFVPLFAAFLCVGVPKGAGSVTFPTYEGGLAYLVDNGSYVTNDFVHIDFTRNIVPDSANLFLDYRPTISTNSADWVTAVQSTFAAFSVPTNFVFQGAFSNNWVIYTDWTPGPTVQTNGILHADWGTSPKDSNYRAAGLAVGIPVQTKIELNGKTMQTPSTKVSNNEND